MRLVRTLLTVPVLVVLSGSLLPPNSAQAPTPPQAATPTAPPSESAKIGTIIKAAVGAFLPAGVGNIVDALFGTGASPNATVKKSAATPAVDSAVKQLQSQAQAKLKDLSEISAELGSLSTFLDDSIPANQRVTRILARLDQPITTSLNAAITGDWTELKKDLQAIGSISTTDLNKIQDGGLKLRLVEVRNINAYNVGDIQDAITAGNVSDVKQQLRAVQSLLNGVVAIVGIEVVNLQTGINEALAWANNTPPQGGAADPRIKRFNDAEADDVTAAVKVLTKKGPGRS